MLLSMLLTVTLGLVLLGVGLRRLIGWPTNLERLGRWGVVLLIAAVLLSGLPDLASHVGGSLGTLPKVDAVSLLCTLATVGLAVLGYVAWVNGLAVREAARSEEARTLNDVRRPARPPAPAAPHDAPGTGTFRPRQPQEPGA